MKKLGAHDLRTISEEEGRELRKTVKRHPLYFIIEDVIDTYNVGGFFRLAEALAAEKVYLCGRTDTPPNPKIMKASVGNYKIVPWEYKKTAEDAMKDLRKIKNMKIFAVEQHEKSKDYKNIDYGFPMAFVFGNENWGMKEETMKLCDAIVEAPMYGLNKSLNVMVAAGIITYRALEKALSKNKIK